MGDEHLISLQPGTVIAGRYEVVKCLGAGSMGLVYACRHRELSGHMVAVKVLFPEVAQDKIAAARFRNEIFASYGVSHPNVVRAYEYLRDGDLVAYTMEYVGGGDLADRLERAEEMPIPELVSILAQMCSGVQAIHDAGIVHRDLKPENILLTTDGHVKIADFGIARTGHGPKLTEHGGVVGTIDYVSPEYMLNSQVDWRSDIYAIGILGYEMVTGQSPFRGDSVYATMTKRLKSDPEVPSSLRPDCPPELDAVILKAMARDPEERYQSASQMFYELQPLIPEEGRKSSALMKPPAPQSGGHAQPVHLTGDDGAEAEPVTSPDLAPVEEALEHQVNEREFERLSKTVDMERPVKLPEQPRREEREQPQANTYRNDAALGYPQYQSGATTREEYFNADAPGGETYSSSFDVYAQPPGYDSNVYDSGEQQQSHVLERTQPLNSEVVEIASQYNVDETVHMASRMDSVLDDYGDRGRGFGFGQTQVITNAAGIDDSRVRRLAHLVDRVERSLWIEVATLAIAILIGVGVGFFVVKELFPGIIESNPVDALVEPGNQLWASSGAWRHTSRL